MKTSLRIGALTLLCFALALANLARAQQGSGNALRFDSTGDSMLVNHTNALNAFPLTVATWLRTTQAVNNFPPIVSKLPQSGQTNGWQLYLNNGNLRARYFADGSNFLSGNNTGLLGGLNGGSVADDAFHHVAFSVDATGGYLYVDGVLRDSRAWVGTPGAPTTTELIRFGLWNNASFIGVVDEVSIWNVALTAAQIQTNMHRSLVGTEPGLIAYYRFNESSGSTTADSAPAGGDNVGLLGGPARILSGVALQPLATTLSASGLTQTSATLNGSANPDNASASAWFEYGFTTNYGNATSPQAVGSANANTSFSAALTGLIPGAVYHFRAVSSNSFGVVFGPDQSFQMFKLSVETLQASDFTLTSARLNGMANPNGLSAVAWFQWGPTPSYGNVTPPQAIGGGLGNTHFSDVITNLMTGIDVHFRAVASNDFGAVFGADQSFSGFAQHAYLKASNTEQNDNFGQATAIDGDTLVVSAPWEASNAPGVNGNQTNHTLIAAGAAYVFVRTGNSWAQQAYLKASNPDVLDNFGASLAISDDTIVIGAPGESSSATGVNGNQGDNSVGRAGAAYVFVRNGTNWSQQAYLKAANTVGICNAVGCTGCTCYPGDEFGGSVAMSGDTIVVGARFEDSNATSVNGNAADNSARDSGAAYVFVRSGTNWSQQAYLKASNSEGAPNTNTFGDLFGVAVAVSGDTVVIGASGEDSNATGINGDQTNNSVRDAGAAYVFARTGTNWTQQAYLKADSSVFFRDVSYFGGSVAVEQDTVVVGAAGEFASTGAAYVFVRSGTNWVQQGHLEGHDSGDTFGATVSVSGDLVAVGAPSEDSGASGVNGDQSDNNAPDAGAAYVFRRSGSSWAQQAYLKASNPGGGFAPDIGDLFGTAVSVSGDLVVAGAPFEDSNATGIDGNQSNNSARFSGAAYVFGPVLSGPEIQVFDSGVNLINNSGSTQLVVVGTNAAFIAFVIRNIGNVDLTGLTTTIDGTDATAFHVTSDPSAPVARSNSTFAVVRFAPFSTGPKTATLHITSNDEDENPFNIQLSGLSLSFAEDRDGDGLNDASEFLLAPLGFNFQVSQTNLVNLLFNNANGAGLYTQTQFQALNVDGPLLTRDPLTGLFSITIGAQKATELTNFFPFPMTAQQTTINAEGKLQFQFGSPDNAAFFRLEAH